MSNTHLIIIDYESYYGKGCDIRLLGTSQYVAHSEFEVLCMGYQTASMQQAKMLRGKQIDEFFKRLKKLQRKGDKIVLCAHNMYFDGYVAYYHYRFHADFYLCTLSMARPLHGSYMPLDLDTLGQHYQLGGKVKDVLSKWRNVRWEDATLEMRRELLYYGRIDVEQCKGLLGKLAPQIPRAEIDIIDLTLRMFIEPVLEADANLAERIISSEREIKIAALEAADVEHKTQVTSDKQFAELLAERGFEVPMKWSEKQEKEIPALAKADLPFQRMQNSNDPKLRKLIDARLRNKSAINETRAQSFVNRSKAPVPIFLTYCGAHTMRWGGGDKFNPQNLPRDGDLRKCLRAPDGYKLVIVDAAQIEARDNATFSQQWDLVDEFAAGIDVYASFASGIYGFEVNKKDHPDERFVGKTGILGLGYQCGAWKYQNMLEVGAMGPPIKIDVVEAERVVANYRQKYYKIKDTWWQLQSMISTLLPGKHKPVEFRGLVFEPNGTVLMPNGLRLHYPGIDFDVNDWGSADFNYRPWDGKYKKFVTKKLYGGLLLENIIQCRSRIMTAGHMMELAKYYKVVMMAHDEIVMCVPDKKAEACLKDALEIMAIPPRWNENCPLEGEGKITEAYEK